MMEIVNAIESVVDGLLLAVDGAFASHYLATIGSLQVIPNQISNNMMQRFSMDFGKYAGRIITKQIVNNHVGNFLQHDVMAVTSLFYDRYACIEESLFNMGTGAVVGSVPLEFTFSSES
jgi:hypothetical protein